MLRRKSKPTGVRQRKASEENAIGLRASERRFRALLENSWIGITMLSAEATILYINQSVTRILGFGVEELVGQNAFTVIHVPACMRRQTGMVDEGLPNWCATRPG